MAGEDLAAKADIKDNRGGGGRGQGRKAAKVKRDKYISVGFTTEEYKEVQAFLGKGKADKILELIRGSKAEDA